MNKKALSPLVATIILVAFSLIIGAITMNWGKSYVESIADEGAGIKPATVVINYADVDTGLKNIQLKHIKGEISEQEYLKEEAEYLKQKKS